MSSGTWKDHRYLYKKEVKGRNGKIYTRYFYEVTGKNGKKSKTSYVFTSGFTKDNKFVDLTDSEKKMNQLASKAITEGGDRKRGLSNEDLLEIEDIHKRIKDGSALSDVVLDVIEDKDIEKAKIRVDYFTEYLGKELVGNLKGAVSDAKDFVKGLLS